MKIISWNVNGIRACYQKALPHFISSQKPDILCIQETKANPDQVNEEIRSLGYQHYQWAWAQKKGYSGVATFLQQKPKSMVNQIGIVEYDSEGRFVISDHEDFLLYNIYFPNGAASNERHNFKQQFLKKLNHHLQQSIKRGRQIIVLGDYNVAHHEVDIYDPVGLKNASGFLPEERKWFDSFLELGFVDSFRYQHPQAKERYSWWSYREMARVRNRGWRIDYICITQGLLGRLKHTDILDQEQGSDHCPILMEMN